MVSPPSSPSSTPAPAPLLGATNEQVFVEAGLEGSDSTTGAAGPASACTPRCSECSEQRLDHFSRKQLKAFRKESEKKVGGELLTGLSGGGTKPQGKSDGVIRCLACTSLGNQLRQRPVQSGTAARRKPRHRTLANGGPELIRCQQMGLETMLMSMGMARYEVDGELAGHVTLLRPSWLCAPPRSAVHVSIDHSINDNDLIAVKKIDDDSVVETITHACLNFADGLMLVAQVLVGRSIGPALSSHNLRCVSNRI